MLIRKYRLQGALAMLLVVAGLFVWRSASSFLPPRVNGGPLTSGERDSREGLAALLRRSVPEADLLPACLAEWGRSGPPEYRAKLVDEEIKRWAGRDPVEGYRAAVRALTQTK
jgi:hypothetical protein